MIEMFDSPKVGELVVAYCKRLVQSPKGPCGLIVDIGYRAFLPKSQVEPKWGTNKSLDFYVGRVLLTQIVKVDLANRLITVSRRAAIEEEDEWAKTRFFLTYAVGDFITGIVCAKVYDVGYFVDLGGVDGMLARDDIPAKTIVKEGAKYSLEIVWMDAERKRVAVRMVE